MAEPKAATTPASVAATLEADVEGVQPALMGVPAWAGAHQAAVRTKARREEGAEVRAMKAA